MYSTFLLRYKSPIACAVHLQKASDSKILHLILLLSSDIDAEAAIAAVAPGNILHINVHSKELLLLVIATAYGRFVEHTVQKRKKLLLISRPFSSFLKTPLGSNSNKQSLNPNVYLCSWSKFNLRFETG